MKRPLIVALVISMGCVVSKEYCATGPTVYEKSETVKIIQGTPTPTPTPSPSPTPTPEPVVVATCAIDFLSLEPNGGLTIPLDGSGNVSLTPFQNYMLADGTPAVRQVSDACNIPRTSSILWSASNGAVSVGQGFFPVVMRLGLGDALVTATLEGHVSNAVLVR